MVKIITKELTDFMSAVSEIRTIKIVKIIGYLKFYSALVSLL
jgi:hypothetical protein